MGKLADKTIGVIGLGLLGRGIAACLLGHGCKVVAVARTDEEHAAALPVIAQLIDELPPQSSATPWRERFAQSTSVESLAGCGLVIESVFEDLALKQSIFADVERVVDAGCILASNTSAIPITTLQQARRHPDRFIGMHWAVPAHSTRFIEIIRGDFTSDQTLAEVEEFSRVLGKDPSVCRKDIAGFIVNRIAYAVYREALHLVEQGVADVETIDRSLRNTMGLWAASCGPLRWIDLSGGPALYAKGMQRIFPTLSDAKELPALVRRLVEEQAQGIANGHGFYNYTPEEARIWADRQERQTRLVEQWLDSEFPVEKEAK